MQPAWPGAVPQLVLDMAQGLLACPCHASLQSAEREAARALGGGCSGGPPAAYSGGG